MKTTKGQKRQGDLLFLPLEKVSGTKVPGRKILVQGEATGHAHVLLSEAEVFVREDGTLEIVPHGTVQVGHDKHGAIGLDCQTEVCIQQEYDPSEALKMRQVRD